ncbi:hypothetical protein Ade02nite_59230 [Paractinoplanes deccanensis]|uniref:Uncharacterized protein n=1 Tax=Paractinoplanes deccanensis TaxID=113561 RepID=A0ABQ3YB76_9ACTN|nr:hypothetical protein Ade02nite_59230 [Actinoplanes deccanensis]
MVLQLDVVADHDAGTHVRPAADVAIAAEHGIFPDLREMPDSGAFADLGTVIDIRRGRNLTHSGPD